MSLRLWRPVRGDRRIFITRWLSVDATRHRRKLERQWQDTKWSVCHIVEPVDTWSPTKILTIEFKVIDRELAIINIISMIKKYIPDNIW